MRTMMLITILVLMATNMAKSEETSVTSKVTNVVVKEWNEIVEFQKTNWQKGKEQNTKNWNTIKSFFTNLTNND